MARDIQPPNIRYPTTNHLNDSLIDQPPNLEPPKLNVPSRLGFSPNQSIDRSNPEHYQSIHQSRIVPRSRFSSHVARSRSHLQSIHPNATMARPTSTAGIPPELLAAIYTSGPPPAPPPTAAAPPPPMHYAPPAPVSSRASLYDTAPPPPHFSEIPGAARAYFQHLEQQPAAYIPPTHHQQQQYQQYQQQQQQQQQQQYYLQQQQLAAAASRSRPSSLRSASAPVFATSTTPTRSSMTPPPADSRSYAKAPTQGVRSASSFAITSSAPTVRQHSLNHYLSLDRIVSISIDSVVVIV